MFSGIGISLTIWLISVILASTNEIASMALFSITPVGIMPFIVGIAHVIIYFIEKKKDGGANSQ
jgi:uncharacterized protein with PQ loop repeat